MYAQRAVQKSYRALVWGHLFTKRVVDTPIDVAHRYKMCIDPKGKECLSYVFPLAIGTYDNKAASIIHLKPHTGRRHQLRVHMHSIGHPIIGDVTYGGACTYPRMMLHAQSLDIPAPVSISVEASASFTLDEIERIYSPVLQ